MWVCGQCGTAYKKKGEAMVCEATCKALKRNIRREARHVRAGEHSRKQGLAIAFSKTRRAGYSVPDPGSTHPVNWSRQDIFRARSVAGSLIRSERKRRSIPRCSICNLFGHSTADHR